MSTDYAEWEREFLASLKEDTGRDLVQWMDAISAKGFSDKNDIIDWLRQQGFMFSKASWLERVHHNGGKPIYAGDALPVPPPSSGPQSAPPSAMPEISQAIPEQLPASPPISSPPKPEPAAQAPDFQDEPAALDLLLTKAKALRPLAQFALREIAKAVAEVKFEPKSQYVSLSAGKGEFAVLVIGPRELKLGLKLGERAFDDTLKQARFTSPSPRISSAFTHMAILNDARQVGEGLMAAVRLAATRES